jgi:CRISPR-associated endonuclease Cas2
MYTLVVYDIGDDRLRRAVEKDCRDAGAARLQYSVFAGELTTPRRERLADALQRRVDEHVAREDEEQAAQSLHVLLIPVCKPDAEAMTSIGRLTAPPNALPGAPGPVVVL